MSLFISIIYKGNRFGDPPLPPPPPRPLGGRPAPRGPPAGGPPHGAPRRVVSVELSRPSGSHQDTMQSPRGLYKAPTDYTKIQNINQILTKNQTHDKKNVFFQKGMSNKKRCRPTATRKHGLGLPILTKY